MKFILLAAGKIAEKFVSDDRFKDVNTFNLVGMIASHSVYQRINPENITFKPTFILDEKNNNEQQLINLIYKVRPDYILSIQYPWILPKEILLAVSGRVLNMHNARLPDYRGYNTISHEILNNERMHTSTLHWVSEEVDMGKIVKTRNLEIQSEDTAYSLWSRSIDSSLCLLDDWFKELSQGSGFPCGEAIKTGGRYYSKNINNYKRIPESASLDIIDKWARAFWFPPNEPAYLQFEEKKLYILPKTWKYNIG